MTDAEGATPSTVVALGASNLARDLPALAGGLARRTRAPVRLVTACGNGRSYGGACRYAGVRTLIGIVDCGLWSALDAEPPVRRALITDIGNDLLYGATSAQVVGWVRTCAERLMAAGASSLVMMLPPTRVIAALPSWRYGLAKALLFPGRRLRHTDLVDQLETVDEALRNLAHEHDLHLVTPDPAWYGVDPIHHRPRGRQALRREIFAGWGLDDEPPDPDGRGVALASRLRRRPLAAAEMLVLGRARRHPQPAFTDREGSSIACY